MVHIQNDLDWLLPLFSALLLRRQHDDVRLQYTGQVLLENSQLIVQFGFCFQLSKEHER